MKIAAILLALAVVAQPALAAERRHSVTDFDRVRIEGPYRVTLVTRKPVSAVVSGSNQAIEGVSVEVQGRTLRIRPNRSAWGGYPGADKGPATIALSAHSVREITLIGSGRIEVDRARGQRVDVGVSGNGRVVLGDVASDRLNLGLIGGGAIQVGGKVRDLKASIQGSGDLDAGALVAENADILGDTAGTIEVGVRGAAKVNALGPGDTTILGSPACTVNQRGSGRVVCGN